MTPRISYAVAVALAAIAGAGAVSCGPPAPPAPKNLLLISIDTLRADHLGCYGYDRPTSPNLDAFAADSVLFENAWATAPWTLPSQASLLTGLYPSHHGAREKRRKLGKGIETLAQRLRAAGFATGGVVNVPFLSRRYGFGRGFDSYRLVHETNEPAGAAAQVTRLGLRWLLTTGKRRSFLFLHYFDLHSDYRSLPRYERMFTHGGRLKGTTDELFALVHGDRHADDEDVARLVGLYDAGIRQLDDELGRVFEALRRLGRWNDTLIVVAADHGEEFHDHGGFSHGFTHYVEMLRVPLLVHWPGGPVGRRIAEPVSLVDVVPTLLEALGLETPAGLDGLSLTSLWRGAPAPPDRPLFAETGPLMRDELSSAREGRFELILDSRRDTQELFDLSTDPRELRAVSGEHPEVTRRLRSAIEKLRRSAGPLGDSVDLPPRTLEQLRALGYDAGAPSP